MTTFWSLYVTVLTLGTIFALAWLLFATRRGQRDTGLHRSFGVRPTGAGGIVAAQGDIDNGRRRGAGQHTQHDCQDQYAEEGTEGVHERSFRNVPQHLRREALCYPVGDAAC